MKNGKEKNAKKARMFYLSLIWKGLFLRIWS